MKRNSWKKIVAAASALALIMGCLTGCGGDEPKESSAQPSEQTQEQQPSESEAAGSDTGTPSEEEPASAGITFPLAEQVELTIATPDGNVASLADNLPVWEEIQKRTNIKINWDVTASKQYVEVMKLRVGAGGGKLPDIMFLPNGLSLAELGGEGTILPLEEYIANSENIQKAYEQ